MQASPADYAVLVFAGTNAARAIAYVPQIIRVCRDDNGATAVSIWTRLLFVVANVATVFYSVVVSKDNLIAFIFAFNASGCALIVVLTASKRWIASRLRS
jgi:hypothetical protein